MVKSRLVDGKKDHTDLHRIHIHCHTGQRLQLLSKISGVFVILFHSFGHLFNGDDPGRSQNAALAHSAA